MAAPVLERRPVDGFERLRQDQEKAKEEAKVNLNLILLLATKYTKLHISYKKLIYKKVVFRMAKN